MSALLATESVRYTVARRILLADVDLVVPAGSFAAIVGPNGSGKTTLLRLLAGVRDAGAGRVLLAGRPLAEYTRFAVARWLSYVPQNTWTDFEITVLDAVAMGRLPRTGGWRPLGRADYAAIHTAIERLDLSGFVDRTLPTLSGGERQRVFIARALAQGSDILLLDEPTSSLDVGHQLELMEILTGLNRDGRTIVAAMHDLDHVWTTFPRSVLLRDGRVVADGATRDVVLSRVAAEAFNVQLQEGPDGRLVVRRPGSRL